MPTGKVKFYNKKAKFGFIIVDDTNREIFTRSKYLIDEISDGDNVDFSIEEHAKGALAKNVKKII